ncbi:MAG: M81 family metallopeptidase, partial [Victivallales bacterium]
MFNIAIGSVMHESNTFSPITTNLEDFKQDQLLMGKAVFDYHRGKSTEIGGMLEALEKRGVSPKPLISAVAIPSGPVSSETFDFILEKLETDLKKLDNPDGLLLALHGGMSTETIGDTEGFLLRRVRKITGPRTLIGVTLDHHANLSKAMVETADFIIGYKTHPHVDQYDIGVKAAETLLFFLENRRRPTMKLVKLPLLLPGESSPVPRAKLLRLVEKLEKTAGVMSASFFIGFPFADHEDVGASAIAVTDGDAELAKSAAEKLAQLIWDLRAEFTLPV